ncbi:MAG: sigma-54-dependent Fis family transcriptional regulator [Lentisphaerae bacterium]|jgi:DNA-binding NtrC family response regulator|nr:sigma-54-dependent Fis family transcriptional regulator [Lentisphaerota bacterium]
MSASARILIAEEDERLLDILKGLLRFFDHRVRSSSDPALIRELLGTKQWDVFFCDTRLWQNSLSEGDFLELCAQAVPPVPVILLADYANVSVASAAMKRGVFAWLNKPLKTELALQTLNSALALRSEKGKKAPESKAEEMPDAKEHFGLIVGEHPTMLELYRQIEKAAPTEMTVLIQGESGTGKELVARAIHQKSLRANKPFVAINCASLPENLLESELFGHLKGAFTGAVRDKNGLFLAADGGTLFLDEVGSIPVSMQLALLRALQEREIRPVGALQNIPVNVRVLAATNEDLSQRMSTGQLRDDLYYRLSVFPLKLPPLRERKSDIPLLARHFISRFKKKHDSTLDISAEALLALEKYAWPGNVRELENSLQRAVALSDQKMIFVKDLPEACQDPGTTENQGTASSTAEKNTFTLPPIPEEIMTLKAYLRFCERHYVRYVLEQFNDDREAAARSLGISTSTLYRKCLE